MGETSRALCGLEEQFLLHAEFPRLAIRDQGANLAPILYLAQHFGISRRNTPRLFQNASQI
jgi:hypothetical protein